MGGIVHLFLVESQWFSSAIKVMRKINFRIETLAWSIFTKQSFEGCES